MQYELLTHRGFQPSSNIPSMTLLFFYSKYKKEREDAAMAAKQNSKKLRIGNGKGR